MVRLSDSRSTEPLEMELGLIAVRTLELRRECGWLFGTISDPG